MRKLTKNERAEALFTARINKRLQDGEILVIAPQNTDDMKHIVITDDIGSFIYVDSAYPTAEVGLWFEDNLAEAKLAAENHWVALGDPEARIALMVEEA